MASVKDLEGRLTISTSPHVRGEESIPGIMWEVVLALLPALFVAVYVFGYMVLAVLAVSVMTAMLAEAVCQRLLGRQVTLFDGSACLTGVLLAFTLPPNAEWYVPFVGSLVAIAVAKHCFGGLGNNIFNPALLGRAFVHFAFPASINQPEWPMLPVRSVLETFSGDVTGADAITSATPLAVLESAPGVPWSELPGSYGLSDVFWGMQPGCIGETSAFALLIGGVALIALKHVNWRMPVFFIGTVAALVFVLPVSDGQGGLVGGLPAVLKGQLFLERTLAHLLCGGLFLGAFFMATDMVTTPVTGKGQIIFAVGAGTLVALIRLYGGYPEGVCYSILLMNTATPLIDRHIRPKLFGRLKPREAAS